MRHRPGQAHEEAIFRMAARLRRTAFFGKFLPEEECWQLAEELWKASRRAYNKGIAKP